MNQPVIDLRVQTEVFLSVVVRESPAMPRCLLALVLVLLGASLHGQCGLVSSPGGSGCGSSTPFGIPMISCSGSPQIGSTSFAISAQIPCTFTASALMLGRCATTPFLVRGPFGSGGFCGPTEAVCALFIDPVGAVLHTGTLRVGGMTFPLPIPNSSGLVGAFLCAQELNICNLAGGSCIGASQAISITVM